MKLFQKEIPFIRYQAYLIGLSLVLTIGALIFIFTHGLKFGIDFTGGIKLQYQFKKSVDSKQIQPLLEKATSEKFVIQRLGKPEENLFAINLEKPESGIEGVSARITAELEKGLGAGAVSLIKEESVGPKAGEELRQKGEMAIIIAWLLILAYLGFRFDFNFSPGAIIGLIHDLIITLGAFAISGREISLTVLAAFLTMIGYSVNDTIIVYDRIRENLKKHKTMPLRELVNLSINETLSRTVVTSVVMLFVVVVLFVKGEGEIQDFALAMIVGVITGTYSSIFIASPIYIFLKKLNLFRSRDEKAKPALKASR